MRPNPFRRTRATAPCVLLSALLLAGAAAAAPRAHADTTRPAARPEWTAAAAPAPAAPLFGEPAPGAEVLRLDNGLRVMLLPNPSQPMAVVFTQVLVGSAWEDYRTSGMSHMLEHLLFNGTDKYTQEELYARADAIGAWNNAHTTDFYTNYIMLVPRDHLAEGMELQSQMLFHSTLPPAKFEKERGIVLGEIVQGKDRPGHVAEEALRDVMFGGSSLSLPTLGTPSTIRHMQRDDVWAFYRRHYVPNNMIVTVAGGFDRARVLELLEKYFGEPAPGSVPRPDLQPAPYIDRTRVVTRRGGAGEELDLIYEAPAYGSADYYPFAVLVDLLSGDENGVLPRALADLPAEDRPEVDVWWQRAPGFGRLVVSLSLPAGADPARYHTLVEDALRQAAEQGFTPADVAESIQMQRTGELLQREQLRMLAIQGSEAIALGGPDFFLGYLDNLQGVDTEEVGRVLSAYLVDVPHLVLHLVPESAAAADTAAAVTLERSVLNNGAVLRTLTNPAAAVTAIHLAVRNRAVLDDGHPGALDLVHRLLPRGIGGCDAACLEHKLRRLGIELKVCDDPRFPMDDYYTNGWFSFVRMETAAENGLDALLLLTDMIQHAGFTEQDAAREKQRLTALVSRRAGSARYRAERLLAEALYGDHPLANPPEGTPESLRGIDYDLLRRLYRRAFAPANLVITVVGPQSHAAVKTLLEQELVARGDQAPAMPPLPVTTASRRVTGHVGGPMTAVRLGSILEVDPADAPALELLTAVLSDRLGMDLRETRGLSYSVGAAVGVHGDRAVLTAWLNPPAARLAEGEQALRDAWRAFDASTVTAAELDRIRSAREGRLKMRRLSSISQAYYLAMAELAGDPDRYQEIFARYDAVTPADLVRVARRYWKDLPLVTVVVD